MAKFEAKMYTLVLYLWTPVKSERIAGHPADFIVNYTVFSAVKKGVSEVFRKNKKGVCYHPS
jgi:hypothetical protein